MGSVTEVDGALEFDLLRVEEELRRHSTSEASRSTAARWSTLARHFNATSGRGYPGVPWSSMKLPPLSLPGATELLDGLRRTRASLDTSAVPMLEPDAAIEPLMRIHLAAIPEAEREELYGLFDGLPSQGFMLRQRIVLLATADVARSAAGRRVVGDALASGNASERLVALRALFMGRLFHVGLLDPLEDLRRSGDPLLRVLATGVLLEARPHEAQIVEDVVADTMLPGGRAFKEGVEVLARCAVRSPECATSLAALMASEDPVPGSNLMPLGRAATGLTPKSVGWAALAATLEAGIDVSDRLGVGVECESTEIHHIQSVYLAILKSNWDSRDIQDVLSARDAFSARLVLARIRGPVGGTTAQRIADWLRRPSTEGHAALALIRAWPSSRIEVAAVLQCGESIACLLLDAIEAENALVHWWPEVSALAGLVDSPCSQRARALLGPR